MGRRAPSPARVLAARRGMERRLLVAGLARRRGGVALAVLAVAIGASVCSALLHVSRDVDRKLTRELRVLGPDLLVTPAADAAPTAWIDARDAEARLARAGVPAVAVLAAVADVRGHAAALAGADLARARALHPSWSLEPASAATRVSWMGTRLARRLGVRAGDVVAFRIGSGPRDSARVALLSADGADLETWWLPLAAVQRAAGLPGRASLLQARVAGDADVARVAQALRGSGLEPHVLHALSSVEAGLLARMRRLMLLVTAAALLAAGLCAFGTLTDLALERRREIALLKALGAAEGEIARQFVLESLGIGFAGGVVGWLLGLAFAELIGREVFASTIAVRPEVPVIVLALSLGVAALAGLGPLRLARGVQPAAVLKGD